VLNGGDSVIGINDDLASVVDVMSHAEAQKLFHKLMIFVVSRGRF